MDLPVFNTLELTVDDDGIATLYLNRPEKMNAFNREMKDELLAAFDFTDQHDEVRAVIVTGKGRAFCAGADLSSGAIPSITRSAVAKAPTRTTPTGTAAARWRCASTAASSR